MVILILFFKFLVKLAVAKKIRSCFIHAWSFNEPILSLRCWTKFQSGGTCLPLSRINSGLYSVCIIIRLKTDREEYSFENDFINI